MKLMLPKIENGRINNPKRKLTFLLKYNTPSENLILPMKLAITLREELGCSMRWS